MTSNRAYLDHNASSALREGAKASLLDAIDRCGNASSIHGEGRDARRIIETARAQVAELVGVSTGSVIFTSSATEAAHLALTSKISLNGEPRPADMLFVLATEHPCVLAGGRFASQNIRIIPVLPNGLINMETFDAMLSSLDGGVPYVAVQLVNSETGIIQPVAEISKKVQLKGGYLLCDAVQAAGRIPLDSSLLGADFLLLSAHKVGGPQGAGALISTRLGIDIPAALRGGGQESNRRAGTENVAAIAGFGVAGSEAANDAKDYSRISALMDSIEQQLVHISTQYGVADHLRIFGTDVDRVGNTVLFSMSGLEAQTALIAFDLEGVAVSSGSACSSGKVSASHVLQAMNVASEFAQSAIRVSLGWNSTPEDADKFITAFERITKRHVKTLKTTISSVA